MAVQVSVPPKLTQAAWIVHVARPSQAALTASVSVLELPHRDPGLFPAHVTLSVLPILANRVVIVPPFEHVRVATEFRHALVVLNKSEIKMDIIVG